MGRCTARRQKPRRVDFKVLADLPPEEAGDFLAGILRELSSTIGLADRRTLEAFVAKASLATT